jgi:hypothetical protein
MKIDATHYAAPYLIIQAEDGQLLGCAQFLEWDPQTQEGRVIQFFENASIERTGQFTLSLAQHTPPEILQRWAKDAYPLGSAEFERQVKLNRAAGKTGFDKYPKTRIKLN